MERQLESRTLAGRAGELALLERLLERAVAGRPGAVLVGGEAGMGKTRLIGELVARAEQRGALVLSGQCVGLEAAAIPLLPVADALSRLPERPPISEPWTALTEAAPERLYAAVDELLRRLSATAPVVLVVEDAHWADRSTLDLLTFLIRRLEDAPALIAITYRSDELGRRDELRPFLADVARVSIVERIELAPLTRAEAGAQLEGILGRRPDPAWADAICARAEGNPFFLEELAAADELPLGLRDMLLARLAALGPDAQEVVRAAAAGGRRVSHRLLAGAVELPERRLTAALREAVRHHILVAGDEGYAFRHALLQEAAYGELLPGERARLHATFARALEQEPEQGSAAAAAAELAHHWHRAGDSARALQAAVRAGEEAERLRAHAEAADHFTRALALWPQVPGARELAGADRATLLERAAAAAGRSGRHALARELYDEAIALVDEAAEPVRAGLLHERRGWHLWYGGRGPEADPAYERAAQLVPDQPPSAARARVLAGWALVLMLTARPEEARALAEQAIAVAQAAGARAEEAEALHVLGTALDPLGERAAGIAHLRDAAALARAAAAPEIEARAAINLSHTLRRHGRLEEALAAGLEGAAVCRRAGLDHTSGFFCLGNAAEAAFELGRWEITDRLTRELLDRGASGMNSFAALGQRAQLDVARGDVDAAAAATTELRDALGTGTVESSAELALLEAAIALARGRAAEAERLAADGARAVEPHDPVAHAELVALALRAAADVAAVARARRDSAGAAQAVARARALCAAARGQAPGAAQPALAATIDAELARAEERPAAACWDAAARAWDARATPHRAAYARWRQAEALLAAGSARAEAAATLRDAHAVAGGLGARPLADEIEALARRARIELAAAPAAAPPAAEADELGLTPREREVLDHLALGQTNRQIAADLFISVKTASVHVSHILDKLGVATRGEAAAVARRLGLVA